ncbi:MAG: endolytic transglycosylase MltG [Rhodobacteraceae bacterium]|nr:endolytic transglycosylase MltG [Paracoccaceae bacterium]
MWRHIASNGLTILLVGLIAAAGAIAWAKVEYVAEGPLDRAICLKVEPGSRMDGIATRLADSNAVRSEALFRVGTDYTDRSQLLKAGSFLLPPGASMDEIAEIITRGGASSCGVELIYRIKVNGLQAQVRELNPETDKFEVKAEFEPGVDEAPEIYVSARDDADTRISVVLVEGTTVWQAVEGLKAADFLSGEVEGLPVEGSLAPDSYEVRPGADRATLIADMEAAQIARLEKVWAERAEDLPVATREEALILASIIEKETGQPEERGLVASVFTNRLNQGIRLQTDPSVIYGVTGGEGVLGRGLRRSELDRETPYNTYKVAGLPPTPIANPGLAALEAAVNPDTSPYIYFVADGTGGHAFAETLAEHNKNVAAWRRFERDRNSP